MILKTGTTVPVHFVSLPQILQNLINTMITKKMIMLIKDQLTILLLWKNVILKVRKNFGITEFVYVMNIKETMTKVS